MKGYSFAKNLSKFATGLAAYRTAKGASKGKGKIIRKRRKRFRRKRVAKFRRRRGGSIKLRGDDVHSGLASNWINVSLNRKLRGRTAARYCYLQNYSGYLTDYAGNQGAQMLVGFCTLSQMTTATTPTPNGLQSKAALFDLDPMQTNTGGNLVSSVAQPANQRIAVYNVRANYMFTNFENVASTLILYFVTPKSSSNKTGIDAWLDGYTTGAYGKAARTRAAAGAYGNTTVGAPTYQDLYNKPTDSVMFNKMYRVLKVHKIQLAAGATEEVNIHVKVNKLAKKDTLVEDNLAYVRGLNVQVMALWYGQPVADKTNAGIALNVTTSTTNIGYVGSVKYTLGTLKSTVSQPYDMYSNNQLAYSTAITDQKFVSIVDTVLSVAQNT